MGTHMKTTIEIADSLLVAARREAERQGTTVRSLVEEGLRRVLAERRAARRQTFKLRDASVPGEGVRDGVREGDWESMQSLIYQSRGG
jgi:hypothetical protein